MHVLARKLFDIGIFSVLTSGAALGVGWKLGFYVGGTATPITTYNARTGGSANSNPLIADGSARFDDIWIEDDQTIKWVLSDADDVVKATVDDVLWGDTGGGGAPPAFDTDLTDFLSDASVNPLPVALGGTGATSAANARTNLATLGTAGGTMTGNITRNAKGVHPYFNAAAMTGGQIYIQAAGADPTSNPGDIVFEY
jgi:hypothetical protein